MRYLRRKIPSKILRTKVMETIFHIVDLLSESISVGCNIFRQFICRPKVNDIPSYYGNFRIIDYNKFICKIVVKYLFNAFNALYLINALYLLLGYSFLLGLWHMGALSDSKVL